MGEDLKFNLSLALFSSFNIDAGTKLLLKTLAQQKIIPESGCIMDAGCGTGIIAISLKKRFPNTQVTASDRDALALKFTRDNAILNKLTEDSIRIVPGLLPGGMKHPVDSTSDKFDLIISNIPAKAGNPVIEDFLKNCGNHLTPGGRAAIVIVATLSDFAKDCLINSGAEILFEESDKNYSVFHFQPSGNPSAKSFPDIYQRTSAKISGFYGLPEFDSVSYSTKLTLEILASFQPGRTALIWNPGVGYIPEACMKSEEMILAGQDLLQLKASDYNLSGKCRIFHLPVFSSLKKQELPVLDTIISNPLFVPGAGVENEIIETSLNLLKKRGKMIISGKSSDISKIEKMKDGFILKHSIKYRGFRSVILEKR